MSRTIDERVVSMKFDNKKFEENIAETKSSLEELDRTINEFGDNGSQSFFDLGEGLSALEVIFFGFYQKIGGYLAELTLKAAEFAKSMSFDQITAGFEKYTSETKAAQAIVANTDATVEETYAAIDRIAAYTDATSYDFTNLTDTMTNFAMAGVKLEDAEEAVKGIGNWAALSGAGIGEANIAMNALVKSMSSGSMQLMEWNTITKSAKMGTRNFTEELIRTARETSQAFRDFEAKNGLVTFENFRENAFKTNHLITSDVLLATLKKYGDAESDLGKEALAAASEAKTFAEALGAVKDAVSGGWAKNFRYIFGNYEEARKFWTFVQDCMLTIFTVGQEFQQEVLSKWHVLEVGGWADAFDALRYAWEGLVNLGQPVADAFQNIFQFNVDDSVKGLQNLTTGFKEAAYAFELLTGAWKNEDVINEQLAAKGLTKPNISGEIEHLTGKEDLDQDLETLKKSKALYEDIRDTFNGIFSAVDLVKTVIAGFAKGLKNTLQFLKPFGKLVLTVTSTFGRLVTKISDAIKKSEVFDKVFGAIGNFLGGTLSKILEVVTDLFGKLFGKIGEGEEFSTLTAILSGVGDVFEWLAENVLNGLVIPIIGVLGDAISTLIDLLKPLYNLVAGAVGDAFKKLAGFLSGANGEISPFKKKLDSAKESVSNFWKEFKESKIEPLSKAFSGVVSAIGGFVDTIKQKLASIFSKDGNKDTEETITLFDTLLGILQSIAGFITGAFTDAFNWLTGKIDKIKGNLDPLVNTFDRVREALKQFFAQFKKGEEDGSIGLFETVGNVLTTVIETVLGLLTKAINWIKTTFSGLDIKGILSVVLDILKGFVLLNLAEFIGSLKGIADGIKGLTQPFKQTKDVTKYIRDLAISLVLLAAGIKLISGIETDKLANALVTIEALLISLVESVQILNQKSSLSVSGIKTGNSVSILSPTFQTQMIDIAAAVLILAVALKKLGSLDWGTIGKGLVALAGIVVELGFFTAMLDKVDISKSAKDVQKLSTALILLSVSLKIISTIPFLTMIGALVGFTVVLGEMTIAVMLLDKQDLTKTGVGMVALSAAMLVMAAALKVLASIPFMSLLGSVVMLGVVMAELIAVMRFTNGTITSGVGVLIMVEAITLLIPLLLSLSLIPFTTILKGLGALAAIFVVFAAGGALMKLVAPGLLQFGLALDAIAASVLILGLGLQALSVGLAALGTAILVFGQVILDNSDVLTEAFKSVLGGLILVFDELLPDLIAAMIKFLTEGTIAVFNWLDEEIEIIVERLIQLIVKLLESLAKSIEENKAIIEKAVADLLLAIIHTVAAFLTDIFNRIFEYFGIQKTETGNWLTDILDIILKALGGIVTAVVAGIGKLILLVIEYIGLLPIYLVKWFLEIFGINTEFLDNIIQDVKDFCKNAWETLKKGLKDIWDKVTGWFKDLWGKIRGIFKGKDKDTGDMAADAQEGMERVTDTMHDTIEDGGKDVEEAALNVSKDTVDAFDQDGEAQKEVEEKGESILESFTSPFKSDSAGVTDLFSNIGDLTGGMVDKLGMDGKANQETQDTGEQFTAGYTNGILNNKQGVWNAAASIASLSLQALRSTLQVKSPSRIAKSIGDFFGQGFALGIDDSATDAVTSAEEMGNSTISVLKEALSGVNLETDEIENPVIRPVLDLSEIQNGESSIQRMLGGNYSIGGFLSSIGKTGSMGGNTNTENLTINMTVNGAAGQDVNVLADIVTRKLNQQLRSQERVWA